MSDFVKIRHEEIGANVEWVAMINSTEFSFTKSISTEEELIMSFICSSSYTIDSRTDMDRTTPTRGGLGIPFNIPAIEISDFKRMSRSQTEAFLIENSNDWINEKDKISFRDLIDTFKQRGGLEYEQFYLLDIDWFMDEKHSMNNHTNKLFGAFWCYSFFFLLISIDKDKQTVSVSEWFLD